MKAFCKIILLLYGCYFSLTVSGQNLNLVSPITISMPNNPVANTDDWGKGAQTFIITAKKNTPNELQSWMLVTIKKGGSKICGSNTPQTAPEVNFDVPLKTWVGSNAISLLGNGCILSPGDYELCVQFYLKDRRTIIGENCKSFTIKESKPENYSPPQNVLPAADKQFTAQEISGMVNFRWTPVMPKPKAKVKYTVRIWDIPIRASGSQVIKNQPPSIVKETNDLTQLSIAASEFKSGKTENSLYAWNVQATKQTALGDIEMLGTSEATGFSIESAKNSEASCDCGDWELFTLNGKNYKCGDKIKWKCNEPIDFSARYNCKPNDGSCVARIECDVKKDGVIIKNFSSGPHPYIDHAKFTPTENGVYTITLYPTCNGKPCPPCILTFTVTDCITAPICDCKSVQFTKKLWYKDVSTGLIKEFACNAKTPIVLNCDKNYKFFADTKCSPDTNCKMIVKGEFRNAAGALVIQQTPFNSTSSAFNIISGTPGNYTFTIRFYVNDVECGNCTIPITVNCIPPLDCCKNSSWILKYENSNGRIGVPVILPACGTKLSSVECNIEKEYFITYTCSQGCGPAQTRFQYYNAATNAPVGVAVNAPTQNQTYIFTPGTAGNYYLKIEVFCGGKLCDSCKYPVEVKCTPPVNCCQNTTQKDPAVYDAEGTNLATFSCTQPKIYYINTANKNCDKELIIKASANCGSNPNCPAKIVFTLKNIGTSATITGTGVLTIPASLANGTYTLTVDYYCGNTICKSCKFEIKKDCPTVPDDCCKNSSWGEKMHYTSGGFTGGAVPKPLPASGSNLGVVNCGSTKQFKICYNCAQGCGSAQIKYDVYMAYSLVLVSSTTVASCSVANITMPATAGNYQIRIAAICNGKECNAMDYFINTECKPVDCCKGGKWTSKSLDWDIKIKLEQAEATELTTEPAKKAAPQKKKDQKTPAGAKIKPVDIGGGQLNPLSGSLKVAKCGDTLKINEGNEFTFNAAYTCNTALANCKGKAIAKVKDPNGVTYGTWPLPRLFNFATPGIYTVTYYAYCGETVCDSCTFYVNAAKDCCKGSKWIKAQYQVTNKKPNGDWDKTDKTYYSLPFTITSPIPVIKADVAIDLEKLEYSCAQGCTSGFILKRKNITTGAEEAPEMIAAGGTPSVYAKPYPQLITIVPTCGGISCGKPIIFRLECLNKDCIPVCISDTIVFSTGMSSTGTVEIGTDPQWYAAYPLGILSPGTAPFFGTSGTGGSATILQNVVNVDSITSYTAGRNITVSKNCTINFSGKLGISVWADTTWATLFKSFKLHKGSSTGPVVWNFLTSTSYANPTGLVGTYVTKDFSGSLAVTPGVYTFVFEYNKAGDKWNYNSMFVTGIIVGNILPTSKDCCPISNTGNTGPGNTTNPYGQAGQLNGLDLQVTEPLDSTKDTVKICEQTWMKKNLDVDTYRNGDPIPEVTDPVAWANLTTGAWCYYNNDPALGAVYGKLYNWYAVKDSRGLAPVGWHVPSEFEWALLANCLGGYSIAGGKTKESGASHWATPNTGSTNSSGLTALPSGFRNAVGGSFGGINANGSIWSISQYNSGGYAWYTKLVSVNNTLVITNNHNKSGFAVRCVKD